MSILTSEVGASRRKKEPANKQVLQTGCLLRGRRCRPLAAPTPAADLHVSAPAKAGMRQQVRMTCRHLHLNQVLSRKESIHRGVTSCVSSGDRRGEA